MHYDDDFIESYLRSTLSAEEEKAFELAIQGDPALADYVSDYAKMLFGIDSFGDKLLSEKIKKAELELDKEAFFITDEEIEANILELSFQKEKMELEQLANSNPNLAKKIEQQAFILEGIEKAGDKELKLQLDKAAAELEQNGFFDQKENIEKTPKTAASKKNALIYYLVAAASIAVFAILVGLGQIPLLSGSVPHYAYFQKLDNQFEQKVEAELSEKGFGGQPKEALLILKEAMFYYKQAEFGQAAEKLSTYLKENPMAENVPQVQLYLATCYLAKKQPKKALPLLLSLQTAPPSDTALKIDAQWYLALTYAQLKKKKEAGELLKGLLSDEKYQAQAEKLSTDLAH